MTKELIISIIIVVLIFVGNAVTENYTKELANKDVTFKVTVREIKERVLPELNEDFYADLGYDNTHSHNKRGISRICAY